MKNLICGALVTLLVSTTAYAESVNYNKEAADYVASSSEENFTYSVERVEKYESARANYICGKFAKTSAVKYKAVVGVSSSQFIVQLDSDIKFTGYQTTGDFNNTFYSKGNEIIQGKSFSELWCAH